ncbi:hypothetical protein M422DRAFT_253306 [Sphaerobolus stellatus SS14]|uniref:Helitron helicase-like domain-containing protein n=1 Tax=Sphaerobolus stellatus (strain SS14) TaxID=990650 RepID=A0A0C9VNA8_SPHS4|nr:hypothetical protein M422DRAFT_253306 [Sphaerobolus stellatus SS14]
MRLASVAQHRHPTNDGLNEDNNNDHGGDDDHDHEGRLTSARYYAYRIHYRSQNNGLLLLAGHLFQQFVVDQWAQIEQSHLMWLKHNQDKLWSEVYCGLADAIGQGQSLEEIGKRFILPSSHIGSPRHMLQLYQDSMAICRKHVKPSYFTTITANPQWPEIVRELLPGQTASDRPDLVARVFALKLKRLRYLIADKGYLGKMVAFMLSIEYQKCGLPHAHQLDFIDLQDQPKTARDVDSIISAQLPDKDLQPELWNLVTKFMMHGPCGSANPNAPCMSEGKCSKNFPKPYREETSVDGNGYAEYACPNNGRFVERNGFKLDNRWVVPYCPEFLLELQCHINTECCISVGSVKYIHKYIYKGPDRATLKITDKENVDEIKQFLDARWIGASEAVWRILCNKMHDEKPPVYRLQVHLPGQHLVVFDPNKPPNVMGQGQKTMLTAYFQANHDEPDAKNYLYQDFPTYFTYLKQQKKWKPRERGGCIGRMYFASPNSGERFYLRMLLTVVCGATSFEALRTVDHVPCDTFYEACRQRGLLQDDGEWTLCLQEASVIQTGTALRSLFATMLQFCQVENPAGLWEQFKVSLCDDLERTLQRTGVHPIHPGDEYDYGLFLVDQLLYKSGSGLHNFPSMPRPVKVWDHVGQNHLITE